MGKKKKRTEKTKTKSEESSSDESFIIVPKIWINGDPFLLLSILGDEWFFKANAIFSKNSGKDPFGNSIEHTSGKGSVKCKPANNSIFKSNYSFDGLELQKIPVKSLHGNNYLLLSRLGDGDTWKFQAKSVNMSKAKGPKAPDPGGDKFFVAKGTKNVLCSPKKDLKLKKYKFN